MQMYKTINLIFLLMLYIHVLGCIHYFIMKLD